MSQAFCFKAFIKNFKFILQSSALQECSGYEASELKDCVLILHDLYLARRGGALQAIREKYKQHKVIILFAFVY